MLPQPLPKLCKQTAKNVVLLEVDVTVWTWLVAVGAYWLKDDPLITYYAPKQIHKHKTHTSMKRCKSSSCPIKIGIWRGKTDGI